MGTTLAFNGAYSLAGALSRHPDDYATAFAHYEEEMRPIVTRAQKLVPGMPHLLHPETAWGVWVMNCLVGFMTWTRIGSVLFMFFGPPADAVPVEEYGFKQMPEFQL